MRLAVLSGLLALGAVAVGCDGGEPLSKGEFVQQANAICAKYERRVRALMGGIAGGNEMQLARSITRVLPVIREGNDELRSLRPPRNLDEKFDRWMTIAEEEVDAAAGLRDALNSRDRPAIQTAFKRLQAKDIEQDRLARLGLGLSRCASRPGG